jgi:RING-type zinc-finger
MYLLYSYAISIQKQDLKFAGHLQCPICLDIFFHPLETLCGHTFCEYCVNRFMFEDFLIQRPFRCPICRQIILRSAMKIRNDLENDVSIFYCELDDKTRKMYNEMIWKRRFENFKEIHIKYNILLFWSNVIANLSAYLPSPQFFCVYLVSVCLIMFSCVLECL